ncbi:mucin-5AC-like [Xenopus laevis]|uniref:Mucin-5AC-like n=1 Tax=Xenopus laevis TaxID=8355 RepID=A0A8J1LK10_XENLA|nr:mucin-5AC-like [Xenopus laevis]
MIWANKMMFMGIFLLLTVSPVECQSPFSSLLNTITNIINQVTNIINSITKVISSVKPTTPPPHFNASSITPFPVRNRTLAVTEITINKSSSSRQETSSGSKDISLPPSTIKMALSATTSTNPRSSQKSTNTFTTYIDEASSKLEKFQTTRNHFSVGTIAISKTNSAQLMESTISQPTINATKSAVSETSIHHPSTIISNNNVNNETTFARSTDTDTDTTIHPSLQESLTSHTTTNTSTSDIKSSPVTKIAGQSSANKYIVSPTSAITRLSSFWNLTSKHQLLTNRVNTVNNMNNNQSSSTSSNGYLSITNATNKPRTTPFAAQGTNYKSPLTTATANDMSRKFMTTNTISSIRNSASALVSSTVSKLSSINLESSSQSVFTSNRGSLPATQTTRQSTSKDEMVSFSLYNSRSTPYSNLTSRQSLLTDTVTTSSPKVSSRSVSTMHTTPLSSSQQLSTKFVTTLYTLSASRNTKMSTAAVTNVQLFTVDVISAITRYRTQSTLTSSKASSANTTLTSTRSTSSTSTSQKSKLTKQITLSSKITSVKPTKNMPHSTTVNRSYSLPTANFAISSGKETSIHSNSTSKNSEPYTNTSTTLINNSRSSTTTANKISSNSKITMTTVISNTTFSFNTKRSSDSKAPSSQMTPQALTSKVATGGGSSVLSSNKSLSFWAIVLISLANITGSTLVAYWYHLKQTKCT